MKTGKSSFEETTVPKILVTGATGFIGYEVAARLAAAGRRPRLMVRRPERGALLRPLAAEVVSGDLTSPPSLERAVTGADTVIHLGARATFESYRRLRPTIIDGSLALMRAAAQAGVRHFVHASSLLVYGDQRRPIDLDTPAHPAVDYGRAKLEAEQALARLAEETGVELAVVRLPHVYGARDLLFERLHRGLVVRTGRGDNPYAHLHVADAARLLVAIADRGWTGVSAVADDHSATWREFFAVLRAYYPRFWELSVPAWLARWGAGARQALMAWRSRPTLVTPDTVTAWNLSLPVRPGLLWDALGLRPALPTISEGIPAALDDAVAFRWRHPVSDPAGA